MRGSPRRSRAAERRVAAELAPHWAAAGRSSEALAASVDAAREAEAVFGLAEAHAHLERALALWHAVPDAAELAGLDLAELCTRAAELASQIGAAARAVELRPARDRGSSPRAIRAVPPSSTCASASTSTQTGSDDACLAEFERAVELVAAEPPSSERAYALGSFAGALCGLALCGVVADLRTGARPRSARRRRRGGGPSAHGAWLRPRLPRPRGRGCRRSSSGRAARRGDRRSHRPGAGMGPSHRCADDARAAPRVGAAGAGGARGDTPVRDRQPSARSEQDRDAGRDRGLGRGRQAQCRRAPRHHLELPVLAAHHPRRRRDRPWRARCRASTPRGRTRHVARGPRPRPLRQPPRRTRPLGAALDRRRIGNRRGTVAGRPARRCPDARPAVRQGAARACRAGGARACPPRCRGSPIVARGARTTSSTSPGAPQRRRRL